MKKKYYIQNLSVLSAFAVVALHVNGEFWNFSYGRYWITSNIIESLFYFAVPIFFMITGVTLVGKNYGLFFSGDFWHISLTLVYNTIHCQ